MTTNTPTRQELADRTATHSYLGVDAAGHEHHFDAIDDVAWIVEDGEVVFVTPMPSVETYIDHVRESCAGGWADLRYDDRDLGTYLSDLLANARIQATSNAEAA